MLHARSVAALLMSITLSTTAMAQAPATSAATSAADSAPAALTGSWRLLSYDVEVKDTGETFPPMGNRPTGYVMFAPEGRVWFVLTGEGREAGETDQEKARLLETVIAYTGRWRIEGDTWITAVDVAWNPAWVGTEQRRQFKLEGERLQVLTPWRVMPNWADKGETRSIITFKRARETR